MKDNGEVQLLREQVGRRELIKGSLLGAGLLAYTSSPAAVQEASAQAATEPLIRLGGEVMADYDGGIRIGETSPIQSLSTERIGNNHHYIQADYSETDINSVITDATAGDHIWWERGTYQITSPIEWSKVLTFHWAPSFQGNFGVEAGATNFGDELVSKGGVVIEQQTAGEDVLKFTGQSKPVFFEGRPILTWASDIINSDTGHGFNAEPPADGSNFENGMGGSQMDGVVVDGHDGDHYAFRAINFQLMEVGCILSWGGGVLELINDAPSGSTEIGGNSIFYQPYGEMTNNGSSASAAAHGIHLKAVNENLNLIKFDRPQVNTTLAAGADNKHIGITESSAIVKNVGWYDANFESLNGNEAASDDPTNITGAFWFPQVVSASGLSGLAVFRDRQKIGEGISKFEKVECTELTLDGGAGNLRRLRYARDGKAGESMAIRFRQFEMRFEDHEGAKPFIFQDVANSVERGRVTAGGEFKTPGGTIFQQRAADPGTGDLADGEAMLYLSDGSADATGAAKDLIYAVNDGGTIETAIVVDESTDAA